MADARELIETAEALPEPRPDPRLPLWNALRAVLDLLIEQGVDPQILADQLILVGHAHYLRLGQQVEELVSAEGWTDPADETSPPRMLSGDDPEGDAAMFVRLTRRLVALMVDARRNTRVEVLVGVIDRDQPPLDLDAWLALLQATVAQREVRRARHPTPQEMVERPGAYEARRQVEALATAPVNRSITYDVRIEEFRRELDQISENMRRVAERRREDSARLDVSRAELEQLREEIAEIEVPPGPIEAAVEAVQRALGWLRARRPR